MNSSYHKHRNCATQVVCVIPINIGRLVLGGTPQCFARVLRSTEAEVRAQLMKNGEGAFDRTRTMQVKNPKKRI